MGRGRPTARTSGRKTVQQVIGDRMAGAAGGAEKAGAARAAGKLGTASKARATAKVAGATAKVAEAATKVAARIGRKPLGRPRHAH